MNRADIEARARAIVDLDVQDVSSALITMYIKDGFDRVISMERRWPFYEVSATLNVVAAQRDYPLATIGAGNIREISSIVDTAAWGARLSLISFDEAESTWLVGATDSSRPQYFSLWGQAINLWPVPTATGTFNIRGYRKPIDWTAADAVPVDADERLHQCLVYYAVAQLYLLQEDAELSAAYLKSFSESAQMAVKDIMRAPAAVPVILSGGGPIGR